MLADNETSTSNNESKAIEHLENTSTTDKSKGEFLWYLTKAAKLRYLLNEDDVCGEEEKWVKEKIETLT